jgi:hypothetical protein
VNPGPDHGAPADLEQWAARRAAELVGRAEAEAVAVLRDALVAAGLRRAGVPRPQAAPRAQAERSDAEPVEQRPAPESRDAGTARETATSPNAATPQDARELLWSYCVVRIDASVPVGMPGIAESRVERIEAEGLAALVSRVPAAQFAAEPLTRNLNDLAWLERVARGHEAVLDAVLAQSTIVPLRMCTLFADPVGVGEMLDRQRDSLSAALDALTDRLEWAVKVLVDRDRLVQAARPQSSEAPAAASGGEGSAYLQRRRTERSAREAVSRLAADTAQQVHARLQDWAIDARTRPPQNRELSGHEGEMVLNAAYLVERARTDELREIVAELEKHHRDLGARIELTGPWPPYNFVPAADIRALA